MALWFSSGAFKAKDVAGVLAEARELGVQGIELSSGLRCSEQEMELIRAEHAACRRLFEFIFIQPLRRAGHGLPVIQEQVCYRPLVPIH